VLSGNAGADQSVPLMTVSVPDIAHDMAMLLRDEEFEREFLVRLAANLGGVNATFAHPMTPEEALSYRMVALSWRMLKKNLMSVGEVSRYIHLAHIGTRGFGKTKLTKRFFSTISDMFVEQGLLPVEVISTPMQYFSMDSMSVPVRSSLDSGQPVVDTMLVGSLAKPNTLKIVLLDEITRGTRQGYNATINLMSYGQVAGVDVEGFLGVVATGNNSRDDGVTREPDYALRRRFTTEYVNSSSGPYFRYLADFEPGLDLNPLMDWYYGPDVTEVMRETLNARTLEKLLWARRLGNPLITALPIVGKGRVRIERERRGASQDGYTTSRYDVTSDTLDKVAALLGVSHTMSDAGLVKRSIGQALDHGLNVFISGESGAGKSSLVSEIVRASGQPSITISAGDTDPENLMAFVVDQMERKVQLLPVRGLVEHDSFNLIIEESNRGSKQVMDRLMEMTGERQLAGLPLPINAIISLGNSATVGVSTLSHDVRALDHAQADRHHISLELKPGDIDTHSWLRSMYGELADHVLAWYDEDLPAEARGSLITPSTCQRLLEALSDGMDVREGLRESFVGSWLESTYIGDEYLPRLMSRLSDVGRVDRISDILAKAECPGGCDHGGILYVTDREAQQAWVSKTRDAFCDLPSEQAGYICRLGHDIAELSSHGLVSSALQTASLDVLRERSEELLPLLFRLGSQSKMPLLLCPDVERKELLSELIIRAAGLGGDDA
jgi:MoxR-like ATPase